MLAYSSLFFSLVLSLQGFQQLAILFFPGHALFLKVRHCSLVGPMDQNKSPETASAITPSELMRASQNSGQQFAWYEEPVPLLFLSDLSSLG